MGTTEHSQLTEEHAARIRRFRSVEQLAAQITEFAGHMNAATYHWLTLIAEFDRLKGWTLSGAQSCAHWLNWQCGIAMCAAREKVRVARALEALPHISAAMARGELSYSNVRALTRVACQATEEYLLMIARHGTAEHVERLVRGFRRCQEAEELTREAQQQANRYLRYRYTDDGSMVLTAQLPAEIGALLLKALAAGIPKPTDDSAESSRPRAPIGMQRADALGVIAESFLEHGIESLSGGERHHIVVHVEAETLRDSTAGCCEIEHGPSIAAETARRLACDASIVTIVENEQGDPLNVGRKTRTIPPALRRALNARDQGCRFPGCSNMYFVDAHHIQHWAHGGETSLSNLAILCRHHHRCVHEGGFQIQVLDDGALRFLAPDGKPLDSVARGHTQPFGDWHEVPAQNHLRGLSIDARTAPTRWAGERMDYGLGVEVLLQQRARAASEDGLGTVD